MENECSGLIIPDKWTGASANGIYDTLGALMQLQYEIQTNVYKYDFATMQKHMGDVRQFCDMNYHAIQDELREFFEALGGMHSYKKAIWKPWKKDFQAAQERPLFEMSEAEITELHFELIDIFHFLFNLCIATGLTPQRLFDMYYAKNRENIERQQRGY